MRTIDCNFNPIIPDGFKLVENLENGPINVDQHLGLFLTANQLRGLGSLGTEINETIKRYSKPLNYNCLLWFLDNKKEIPRHWEQQGVVMFWGTIFLSEEDGKEYAAGIRFRDGEWKQSGWMCLTSGLPPDRPGVIAT